MQINLSLKKNKFLLMIKNNIMTNKINKKKKKIMIIYLKLKPLIK